MTDLHFLFSGPVVGEIEGAFAQDWRHATGETLPEPDAPEPAGPSWCRVIPDGPDEDMERIAHVLLGAVGAARTRLGIMTPYFLPTRELSGALVAAALRPAISPAVTSRPASRARPSRAHRSAPSAGSNTSTLSSKFRRRLRVSRLAEPTCA